MPFSDFVKAVASIPDEQADFHFRSQHTFVTDGHGRVGVDFVGRFERWPRTSELCRRESGFREISFPGCKSLEPE
jgi:hypothetical protein